MVSKPVQFWNEYFPIDSTLSGITILVIFVHPLNAASDILATSVIITSVSVEGI